MKPALNDGTMGLKDTISLATGFAIGSGVITMTGPAIGMTGRSVVLSYILTALTFLIAMLPTIIMVSIYPTRSASYIYSKELIHPKVGGFYMFIYFLGRLTIAVFGISFAQYLSYLLPGINQRLVALGLITFFYIINLFGNRIMAAVQNIMFYILVLTLVIFIVAGLQKVNIAAYFAPEGFFIDGFSGVWAASSLLVFAIGGAGVLADFGDQIRNPAKVIPWVVLGVTVGVAAAYALLSIVVAGVLPYEEVAYQPLTNSAAAVFGKNSAMYVLFILGGALLALTTTLNSSFSWYTNAMLKGCREGWFPRTLATENRYGVPWKLTTIFYLFGAIPALLQIDIVVLSKMAVGLTTFMWTIPVFGLVNLPKRHPEAWKASKYARLPKWSLWLMSAVSFAIYASQTISLFRDNPKLSNILIVLYVAVVTVYILALKKYPGMASEKKPASPPAKQHKPTN